VRLVSFGLEAEVSFNAFSRSLGRLSATEPPRRTPLTKGPLWSILSGAASRKADLPAKAIILCLNTVGLCLPCVAAPKSFTDLDEALLRLLPFGEFGVFLYSHNSSSV
jgi:hypothetical protein